MSKKIERAGSSSGDAAHSHGTHFSFRNLLTPLSSARAATAGAASVGSVAVAVAVGGAAAAGPHLPHLAK